MYEPYAVGAVAAPAPALAGMALRGAAARQLADQRLGQDVRGLME